MQTAANTDIATPAPTCRREGISPEQADKIRRSPPRNMSIAEGCIYTGISKRTMLRHIAERRITVIRIGGRVLIRLADLDRDLERLAVRAI